MLHVGVSVASFVTRPRYSRAAASRGVRPPCAGCRKRGATDRGVVSVRQRSSGAWTATGAPGGWLQQHPLSRNLLPIRHGVVTPSNCWSLVPGWTEQGSCRRSGCTCERSDSLTHSGKLKSLTIACKRGQHVLTVCASWTKRSPKKLKNMFCVMFKYLSKIRGASWQRAAGLSRH